MTIKSCDLADRATILRVKRENGLPVDEELAEFEEAISHIDPELVSSLHEVNKQMWEKERFITSLFEGRSYHIAGMAYKDLRELNLLRNEIKNKIAAKYDRFPELKDYESKHHNDGIG